MRILIAEDQPELRRMLVKNLTAVGYTVDGVPDGAEALAYLDAAAYDAAVLDIMMPKVDGLTVLRTLRARGSALPVLLLTARDAVADRVDGLDAGADDYLIKPFAMDELLARLRVLTRKKGSGSTNVYTLADLTVDTAGFEEAFRKHQELSHQGAEQKFKGGLADTSEETARLHTATHLLHAALRKVLGDEVAQKGSNITAERLRFDFSFGRKVTKDELAQVEKMVNEAIQAKVPVVCEEMTVPEAKEKGAIGLFESKYGEKVRTYKMGDYSFEICGGPHAQNTGDLGTFKIQKEESSSAGVRRIKAVLIPDQK